MPNETTKKEIESLREIRWKTHLSNRVQEFSKIIQNDRIFEEYFSKSYVENLTNKSQNITKFVVKLGIIYSLLMLSLFASLNSNQSDFEIFGYGFKNIGAYKELLLFLAVTISPITAILLAYQKYIDALRKECLKKIVPDASVRKFYSFTFIDDYFDGLTSRSYEKSTHWHGSVNLITVLFGFTLLLLIITLLAGSFFIQIMVIYDVVMNPSTSKYINLFVVVFAITSILFTWLVSLMQLPMPEVDWTNTYKLSEIEKTDPDKYNKLMQKFAADNSRKEAFSIITSSSIIYIICFTTIALYWYSETLENLTFFLGNAMTGYFVVLFFSNESNHFIRKRALSWFFKNHPESEPNRLKVFNKVQKTLLFTKVIIPALLSIWYAFNTLPTTIN
ncbi:hypothetical protein [Thiomicrorhabdus sp.]|uniref:hypothetical protein n=1 Tax=Thiomicrorhabdus sp. TaxID=2039724 RepID=UPI002AA8C505|nr:hypothetical protein [Thiomicrorhabdus sp.]